jgi:hypothetical protein
MAAPFTTGSKAPHEQACRASAASGSRRVSAASRLRNGGVPSGRPTPGPRSDRHPGARRRMSAAVSVGGGSFALGRRRFAIAALSIRARRAPRTREARPLSLDAPRRGHGSSPSPPSAMAQQPIAKPFWRTIRQRHPLSREELPECDREQADDRPRQHDRREGDNDLPCVAIRHGHYSGWPLPPSERSAAGPFSISRRQAL